MEAQLVAAAQLAAADDHEAEHAPNDGQLLSPPSDPLLDSDDDGSDDNDGSDNDDGSDDAPDHDIDLNVVLDEFVEKYTAGIQQRDKNWFKLMGTTIGGSEISSLMGTNPYSSLYDVAASKLAILQDRHTWIGGDACWWGTLFEDVLGSYVEIDMGNKIKGDNICIQTRAGHRNSPDGYIVAKFAQEWRGGADDEPTLKLVTTDMNIEPDLEIIILLEFKCPLSRKPTRKVPKHYIPQLWSGLAVSPLADFGIFVDSVFRKCALQDMGNNIRYDRDYHVRDGNHLSSHPGALAWGLIGVYAPKMNAPAQVRFFGEKDVAHAAWDIKTSYMSYILDSNDDTVIDLGEMDNKLFVKTLEYIDSKAFPVKRCLPWCYDGRGNNLSFDEQYDQLCSNAPEHHILIGLLPWKLFEVNYVPVERNPQFFEQMMPLINKVHTSVSEAMSHENPQAHLKTLLRPPVAGKQSSTDNDLQDLFDACFAPSTD
jgi:hypothetical protein